MRISGVLGRIPACSNHRTEAQRAEDNHRQKKNRHQQKRHAQSRSQKPEFISPEGEAETPDIFLTHGQSQHAGGIRRASQQLDDHAGQKARDRLFGRRRLRLRKQRQDFAHSDTDPENNGRRNHSSPVRSEERIGIPHHV